MKNFHLIGQNIQTSLSPAIHNFLFQLKGFSSYKYSLYPEDNAMLTLDMMKHNHVAGVSITIPFKQSYSSDLGAGTMKNGLIQAGKPISNKIMQDSKHMESAEEILAKRHIINTIKMSQIDLANKCIYEFVSFNTDIFGVKMCFNHSTSPIIKEGRLSQKTMAVVIGGGATAQVFMSLMQESGIQMIVLNRSIDKVVQLQNAFYPKIVHAASLSQQVQDGAQKLKQLRERDYEHAIVINTLPTSVLKDNLRPGKSPQKCNSLQGLLEKSSIKSIMYMDVNYRDREGTLLGLIRDSVGKRTSERIQIEQISSGLDMLLWQAVLQNHIFCQQSVDSFISGQLKQNFYDHYAQTKTHLYKLGKLI